MYAKFKSQLDEMLASEDAEVDALVEKAWRKIRTDFEVASSKTANSSIDNGEPAVDSKFWTTAHLFISSTFRDMGAEREYIVKKVLPELADWAEKRGVRLVETDLRWGVPAHSTTIDTIETCLGELEQIKQNSKGQPLFLCMLGDRYGWIPNLTDIPEEVAKRYDWVDSLSITHMEILQGALRYGVI